MRIERGVQTGPIGIRYIEPSTHQVRTVSSPHLEQPWSISLTTDGGDGITAWVDVDNEAGPTVTAACTINLDGKPLISRTIAAHSNLACKVPDF